jgi:mRNA-degrading endonuclease toxin of MazEF toxin-antitoxin module
MSKIEFPQPEVEAPEYRQQYFFIDGGGESQSRHWSGDYFDLSRLKCGNVYLDSAQAAQRIAYDAQQMARMVIPAWFRAMGPDVEIDAAPPWAIAPDWWAFSSNDKPRDWSQVRPDRYRAKPSDVIVTVIVNGVAREFRWPATVKAGEPLGPRHMVNGNDVVSWDQHTRYGGAAHHTRAGAEAQLAAIRAAAGESL